MQNTQAQQAGERTQTAAERETLIYRDALDRIASGEFANDVSSYDRILSLRKVARDAIGEGTALFFSDEMKRQFGIIRR